MRKKVLIILDIILVIAILILLISAIIHFTKSDSVKFKEEYEALNKENVSISISKDNPIKYIDINEVFDILQNKTGVIYFGFPGCPWCRNMLPILFDVAHSNNVDTINYFNPREIRGNNNEDYSKLINILSEYLEENEEGKKVLYVPDVYFVKDGTIVGHHLGTVESQESPYEEMNIEQKQELTDIFNELFMLVK
ncbi:MAG: hypothetical protein NC181_04315 [Clostridium sp.]|nr:hypothetical protein [Clostridium sp.]MCM1444430.1 hypothetical protein [Candidatus Amulumruptor caecigallinarius]